MPTVADCYATLGIIHQMWKPLKGRIKDYIAQPKPNGYQSLHTTVFCDGGEIVEIQIRTEQMHQESEYGIAAHWHFVEEGKESPAAVNAQIAWVKDLIRLQQESLEESGKLVESVEKLKIDVFQKRIFVFTPSGDVIDLPEDATPVDFAYAIHSDVGNRCIGAKINGRIVQLKQALPNGDVVEIQTQAGHLPSKDWLALVKTSRARNKIKHVINTTERAKAVEIGQKYLEREARRLNVQLGRITKTELERVAAEYGYSKIEDLHAALGYGKYSARQVLQKLAPELVPAEVPEPAAPVTERPAAHRPGDDQDLVVQVKGIDDLMTYRAKCCNPIRGESIVGYVTRGKGVAVHAIECPNVLNLMYEPERRIDVEWARDESTPTAYPVKITVACDDRFGMLKQITAVISDSKTN
ncbi:MAG: RelA/SpoT family protein, partial [Terriglobia bacterium]